MGWEDGRTNSRNSLETVIMEDTTKIRRLACILSLLLSIAMIAGSQERSRTDEPTTLESLVQQGRTTESQRMPSSLAPLDAPLNPDIYIVGPGDVFSVNTWASAPMNFILSVTPEGTLVVPTVGELHVADSTLSGAKKKIISALRSKYTAGDVSVTLVSSRLVSVRVTGEVSMPGRVVLYASDRVDKAILIANGEIDKDGLRVQPRTAEEMERYDAALRARKAMSQRNIVLKRRGGAAYRVDLPKYYATSDDRWNPSLLEGDEIVVPQSDGEHNSIGVFGAVLKPGRFEHVQGETLSDALALAGGLSQWAMRDTVDIYKGDSIEIASTIARVPLTHGGMLLDAGDRVVVRSNRELRGVLSVTVSGEVRNPGTYPIDRDRTRVTDILAFAGGMTPNASPRTVEIRRSSAEGKPDERQAEFFKRMAAVSALEDTSYFRMQQGLQISYEIVSMNLERYYLQGDTSQNVLLRDGDQVFIPSRYRTVFVLGEVVQPGHIQFIPGSPLSYYISKAGGYTDDARSSDVKILKAGTLQALDPPETTIEEGDEIWVPKEVKHPASYVLNNVAQIASIITGAFTVVVLILQLNK